MMKKLKLFSLLMLLFVGVTSMWATDYQLVTSTADLVVGAHYVIGASYNSKFYVISTTANDNNRKMVEATMANGVVTGADNILTFTLGGSSNAWTLKTDNYAGTAGYLNATSTTGSNNLKIVANLDTYAYFTIAIANGVATVTCNGKDSRNILYLNGTTCFSCYNNQTGSQYVKPGLYKEVTAGCDKKVTVSKGTPSNGAFNLSKTGEQNCCEALTVTVTDITPVAGYTFGEITQSGIASGVTINQEAKTVTYAANTTGTSTINVTFDAIPTHTVSFSTGAGNPEQADIAETVGGAGITLPDGPTPACSAAGWVFAGWKETSPVASETTTAPTLLAAGTSYKPSEDCTLYAVYKRTESGAVTDESVKEDFEKQTAGSTYNSTQTYTAENSNAELAWTMFYGTVSTNDKIAGSNSAQMRLYSSATDKYGYIKTTTPVSGLQSLAFKARVSSTDIKMSVWYSTDGENWTLCNENETFSATGTGLNFSSTINGTVGVGYFIKIGVGDGASFPSSSSTKLIIDEITFNYKAGASTTYYLSEPSCTPDFYIAGDFTSWGTNKIPVIGESKTVSLTAGSHELKVIDGEAWKGFDELTVSEMVAGLYRGYDGSNNNICFTLAEDGDVTVTYDGEVFKLEGNFAPQTVKIAGNWNGEDWEGNAITATLSADKKSATAKKSFDKGTWTNFKPVINDGWYGASTYTEVTRTSGAITGLSKSNDPHLYFQADATGEYEFTWTFGTNALNVAFPPMKYAANFSAEHGSLVVKKGEETVDSGDEFVAGTELTVTATPDTENHYIGGTIKVVKTASPEVDVTSDVLDGSTLTVPDYDITISATFTPTYAITTVADGGSIALEYTKGDAAEGYAVAGTAITATATADGSHTFASLAVSENVTSPTIDANVVSFTMPAGAVTVTATFDVKSTPTITVSESSIAFDAVDYKGALAAETFNVSGVALAAGQLTIACNNEAFTVSPATIDVDGILAETEVTVTPKTTACGTFNGKITISGGNAEAKEVSLSLTVNKLAHGVAWGESAKSGIIGESYSHPTLSNPHKLMVALSSEDEDIAYFDEGNIVLKAPGTVKIYANVTGTNDTVALPAENAVYYTLTVQKKYTAKWYLNGEVSSSQTALPGTDLEVPSDPTELAEDCADMVFKGWASAPIVGKQDDAPDFVNFDGAKMPSEDVNYYAVFATMGVGDPVVATIKHNVSSNANMDGTNQAALFGLDASEWSVVGEKGGNNNNVGLNATSKDIRLYYHADGGNTFTVTAPKTIASIEIALTASYDNCYVKVAGEAVAAVDGVYPIDANSFVIGNANTSNTQVRFTQVTVNCDGDVVYSNYRTTCPECTKVTLSKAAATNGSFVLKQNGVEVSAPVKTCEATTVDVVATPATGYELTNVALSGVAGATYAEGVISIPAEASGELTVTATFSAINYTVTLTQEGGAAVELEDQENKHYGDVIELEAPDKEGFIFVKWSATPEVEFVNANAASTTFPMPNSDVTVKATYAKLYNVEALMESTEDIDNVAVRGYVTSIKTAYDQTHHNISYYISDNGKETVRLQSYRGVGDDAENITVGDKVLVVGDFTTDYDGELKAGNTLLSRVALSSIAIDASAAATAYEKGDAFELNKVKATATFADASTVDVTAWATWTPASAPEINAAGDVELSATWCDKSDDETVTVTLNTHAVTFEAPEHGTLVVKNGGVAISSGNAFAKGTVLTVEAAANAGYKLTALTAGGVDILESKQFTVGTAAVAVEATVVAKTAAGLSWPNATATAYTVGKSYTLQTLTNPNSLTVAYASSNTDVATINAESGAITVKAAGSTVITATSAETDVYAAGVASYTLNVYAPATVVVTGDATKKAYYYNETFSFDGLGAKATYADEAEYEIPAEEITWAPATAPVITADANIAVTATWQGITSAEKVIAVTKQLRELGYEEFKWASYATETLLQGYSAMPAVREVIIPDGLSVSYRSGDPTVLTVNETTGAITELKKAGYVSMFVEFAGNDEYAAADRSYPIYVYGLDRIELSGAATKTAYETGDAFEHAGLVATAVYTLGSETPQEQVVTDLATWTPDPATIAANTTQVSVTAAWNGKTSAVKSIPVMVNTYAVTFEAPANGTLVVKNGGAAISSGNEFAKGTMLTVEAAANAGYKLTALTAGGVDILESKQFTVGTAAVAVVATVEAKTAAGLSWPNATATAYTVGKSYTLQTLTNPHSLTVAYASSNTDVATINAESGVITVKAAGSTVITATSAETDVYAAGEASYTLDVYGPAALAISGTATKTSYEKGDAFDRTGLVASVLYGDASVLVVTDLATWTADPATVTANGNVTVTAEWEGLSDDEEVAVTVKTHKVIFDAPTNGSLEILNGEDAVASGAEFVAGTELTITATADQGYKLSSLTVNGEDFVSGETYTMGAQAVVVVATFVQDSGTTIDNAEAGEQAEKIMLNNQLFILRGGKMYDAQGKLVK